MLINDDFSSQTMPLSRVLSLGSKSSKSELARAEESLCVDDPELTTWGQTPRVLFHRDYSGKIKDNVEESNSNEILVLVLGKTGKDCFQSLINTERTLNEELEKFIGSDIIHGYAVERAGFEKAAINISVAYKRDPETLNDLDPSKYLAIFILESEKTNYSKQVVEWLSEDSEHQETVSVIYCFSNTVSEEIHKLNEEIASNIASSWITSVNEITPGDQLEFLFGVFRILFVEDLENTSKHCQSIIQEYFFALKAAKEEDGPKGDELKEIPLQQSCKLTSSGHNWLKRFVDAAIGAHKSAFKKVKSLILPSDFLSHSNPRSAMDDWLERLLDDLVNNVEDGKLLKPVSLVFGIFDKFDTIWDGDKDIILDMSPEEFRAKVLNWAIKEKEVKAGTVRQMYKSSDSHNPSAHFYGGKKNTHHKCAKLDGHLDLFDEFNAEDDSKFFHPKYWEFFKKLFHVVLSFKYGKKTTKLLPEVKKRVSISKSPKVQSRVSEILLCEEFLKLKRGDNIGF